MLINKKRAVTGLMTGCEVERSPEMGVYVFECDAEWNRGGEADWFAIGCGNL